MTDRGKVEGTEATFARENQNQGPPIFFLINWQASTLENFLSICCRLDLGINFILLLGQTGLAVSRVFKIWRTWQHDTRDETQVTGCLHGTFWGTLLLDWLQLVYKLVQIYTSCCTFLYLCIFQFALLIYCIFIFNFIDENIRVHGNEHPCQPHSQVKCEKGKMTGKPGSP